MKKYCDKVTVFPESAILYMAFGLQFSRFGEVTLESEEAIRYAEKLYGILTDKEKESIENRIVLADARETYDRLVQEAIAAEQAAKAAAEEAARIAALEAAMPAMDSFLKAANSIVWNLELVAKYAPAMSTAMAPGSLLTAS